jgi:hypothetical protein
MKAAAPTLRSVYRGAGPDELVLVGSDGRAVLVKGDGLTAEECVRMREAAFRLLGGTSDPAAVVLHESPVGAVKDA